MSIPKLVKDNFSTLVAVFNDPEDRVCLLECTRSSNGEPIYLICAINEEDGEKVLIPFAELFSSYDMSDFIPPGNIIVEDVKRH